MATNASSSIDRFGQQILRNKWSVGGILAVVLLGIVAFYWSKSSGAAGTVPAAKATAATSNANTGAGDSAAAGKLLRVEVVRPSVGSMPRTIPEPGIVRAFDYADLYAKVSGFLQEQSVDIGDAVVPGQLLAKLSAPELAQAVDQAEAQIDQAKAQVKLSEAAIVRARADLRAAKANVNEKEADFNRETKYFEFRQIQYERIKNLYDLKAVEEKLVDQNRKERDAAVEAENAAQAAIETAKAEVSAKEAKIVEAQADLANSKAKIQVANAVLEKAKVFVKYLEIRSPYKGTITKRNFHVGDFIRPADQGGGIPVLVVARTDKMRVIVKMPENYVPYTDRGDPALVVLDALAGKAFHANVSRIGNSLDANDLTMRVEVDLENTNNELRDGMFVHVTVDLTRATKELSVPSTALVGSAEGTTTSVYAVQNGLAKLVPVKVGRDNGVQAEILSGIKADDLIVRHPTADLFSGEKVTPVETPQKGATAEMNATEKNATEKSAK